MRHDSTIRVSSKRKVWGRIAVLIALMFGLVFALSGTSSALSDEDMASDVLQAVLSDQGIALRDDPVHDRLEAEVADAIRAGAVLWETLNDLGFRWTASESQESSASSSPTSDPTTTAEFPGEMLRERIRERIREQLQIWSVIAPEWRQVFEQLRERIRECRDSAEADCWPELRLQLQYEHADRFQQTYENRYQEMQSSGDAGVDPAELERIRERTQERVESIIQETPASDLDDAGLQQGELEQLQERLREQAGVHAGQGGN